MKQKYKKLFYKWRTVRTKEIQYGQMWTMYNEEVARSAYADAERLEECFIQNLYLRYRIPSRTLIKHHYDNKFGFQVLTRKMTRKEFDESLK